MNANLSTDRLVQDLRTVARDTEEILKAGAGEVGEQAHEARARLAAALDNAKAAFGYAVMRRFTQLVIQRLQATRRKLTQA